MPNSSCSFCSITMVHGVNEYELVSVLGRYFVFLFQKLGSKHCISVRRFFLVFLSQDVGSWPENNEMSDSLGDG